jgi:hypothetical protein
MYNTDGPETQKKPARILSNFSIIRRLNINPQCIAIVITARVKSLVSIIDLIQSIYLINVNSKFIKFKNNGKAYPCKKMQGYDIIEKSIVDIL